MNHLSIVVALFIILSSCAEQTYVAGDVYSISGPDGRATVVKVIKAERDLLYLKVYSSESHSEPPVKGFLLASIPVNIDEFTSWDPERISDITGDRGSLDKAFTLRSDLQ
jgi:hypothetical protein